MSFLQRGRRPDVKPARAFQPGLFITVFADASFCPDTKAFGYGFRVKWGDPAKTHYGHGGGAFIESSLHAEVRALEAALEWIVLELLPEDVQGKRVCVQSDCTGALARVQQEVFHNFRHATGAQVVYVKHVKGHQGHKTPRNSVNTTCDKMAGRVMRHFRALHNAARA